MKKLRGRVEELKKKLCSTEENVNVLTYLPFSCNSFSTPGCKFILDIGSKNK